MVFSKEQHFVQILVKDQSTVDSEVYATKLSLGRRYLRTVTASQFFERNCRNFVTIFTESFRYPRLWFI